MYFMNYVKEIDYYYLHVEDQIISLCSDVKALTGIEFGNKFTNHHICYTNKKELK